MGARRRAATATGTWRWNDITVAIPAILTRAQHSEWAGWKADTAQPQLTRGAYLLGGRASTPCGGHYHGRTAGSQTPVYACKRRLTTRASNPQRCGCLSIPVDTLDHAVWTQIRAALTQPDRLATLTRDAARGPAGPGHPDIGGDTLSARIADTAESIARLQQAIAEEYQAARDDGYDPTTARLIVAPLHADLKQAQDELSRLSKVRAAITSIAGDATDARRTIDDARAHLDNLDVPGKQQILDALAVTVQVTAYQQCTACGGTGYQPIPPGYGRHWPPRCPNCRRMRMIPEVTVQITAPQALLAASDDTLGPAATAG